MKFAAGNETSAKTVLLFFCCLAVLYRQNNAHVGNKLKIKKVPQ